MVACQIKKLLVFYGVRWLITHKWKASISEILTVNVQTLVRNNTDGTEDGKAFSSPRGANSAYLGYVALSMLVA
jgi:hypothetical protein